MPEQSEVFPGNLAIEQRCVSLYSFFLVAADNSLFLFLELRNTEREQEITSETDTGERHS